MKHALVLTSMVSIMLFLLMVILGKVALSTAAMMVTSALYVAILLVFVVKLIHYWRLEHDKISIQTTSLKRYTTWGMIAGFIIAHKILTYMFAYVVALRCGGGEGGVLGSFERIWCYSGIDAPSYLGIAENWYVTEGDPMYHIVFFPMYAIAIKAVWFVVHNYLVSAVVVSTVASIGIGIVGYELVRIDYSEKIARNFVIITFTMLGAFFYCAPMTEALFVLLCLLCLYCAKKRIFALAAVFGALAAFTRSPGVLLMLPVGIEYIREVIEKRHINSKFPTMKFIVNGLFVLCISIGLIGYLAINYEVWGDAFKFSQFQKEHWGQAVGWFFDTARYQTQYLLGCIKEIVSGTANEGVIKTLWALWIPQLVAILGSLAVVFATVKKLRVAYVGYFLVYFAFTIGATWLLSAPRYLMASVTVPLALALLAGEKLSIRITVIGIGAILGAAYLVLYVSGAQIY